MKRNKASKWIPSGAIPLSILVTALGFLAVTVQAAQGKARLDPSFGIEGVTFSAGSPGNPISPARTVAVDSKGRLIALGNDKDGILVLARFNSDGSLDDSFGATGHGLVYAAEFNRRNPIGGGAGLAITPVGVVLTTGSLGWPAIYPWNPRQCGYVSHITSVGLLDHGFADDGRSPLCMKGQSAKVGLTAAAISLGRYGDVIVAGQSWHSKFRSGGFIARLTGGGSTLDRSFKGNSRTRTAKAGLVEVLPPKYSYGWFTDVKQLGGGKILAAGSLRGRYLAARFLGDGRLDRSFGKKGIASFDLDIMPKCRCSNATGMAIDSRGRIILSGHVIGSKYGDADLRLKVIRLKPNGRLDRSFGKNGVAKPTFPDYFELDNGTEVQHFLTQGVSLQRDGKIVIAGELNFRYALVRLKADGTQDPAFFNNGLYTDWVLGRRGSAWDVTTDQKGRIISSGGTDEGNFVLMRMLPGE